MEAPSATRRGLTNDSDGMSFRVNAPVEILQRWTIDGSVGDLKSSSLRVIEVRGH